MFHHLNRDNAVQPAMIIEIIGWAGVAFILVAYALVSFNVISNQHGLYQILNLIGALAIIIHSASKKDYQPILLNVIWALIAVFALLSLVN